MVSRWGSERIASFVTADESAFEEARRRTLRVLAAAAFNPLLALSGTAGAATSPNLRFRVLRKGSPVGVHSVSFRNQGGRLVVTTHIDIAVKVLMFTVFHLKHDAEEIWQAGRLTSVRSTTDDDGTRLQVSGSVVEGGFRVIGEDGPFLAPAHLLTSNTLWDTRMLKVKRVIDVQYGGVIGVAVKSLGHARVQTPQGLVLASSHHLITPHYTGTLFHNKDGRWVKGLIEAKGEVIEYAAEI